MKIYSDLQNLLGKRTVQAALTREEAEALIKAVRQVPQNGTVVQIGAWKGVSTSVLLAIRPDIYLYSVDIKRSKEEFDTVGKLLGKKALKRLERVLGDSGKMDWDGQCDMIYIDGDHREPGVRADCKAWIPKVKDGGLVTFHDYIPLRPPPKNQVAVVVDEYCKDMKLFCKGGRVIGFVK